LTPVVLERGGKDAFIVAADADVDHAAAAAVYGALTNAGQACISVERVYVVDAVYDQFVRKVSEEAGAITAGSDDDCHIGAITRPEQVDIIRDHIEDALAKGATAIVGGNDAVQGNFVQPTVLIDVSADMKIMRDETFGPVLPIMRVRDTEEAVRKANESSYGLGSAVFGRAGVRKLADRIHAGSTAINSVIAFAGIPTLPFGGIGDSGSMNIRVYGTSI
jgi:acyl-CoA reductase-like NAD-dependent aldehyde dehydrogenase